MLAIDFNAEGLEARQEMVSVKDLRRDPTSRVGADEFLSVAPEAAS
jgi:hypothetical protein